MEFTQRLRVIRCQKIENKSKEFYAFLLANVPKETKRLLSICFTKCWKISFCSNQCTKFSPPPVNVVKCPPPLIFHRNKSATMLVGETRVCLGSEETLLKKFNGTSSWKKSTVFYTNKNLKRTFLRPRSIFFVAYAKGAFQTSSKRKHKNSRIFFCRLGFVWCLR